MRFMTRTGNQVLTLLIERGLTGGREPVGRTEWSFRARNVAGHFVQVIPDASP
jgi:hypothetical protein